MNIKTICAVAVIAAIPALSHAQAKDPAATPGIDKRQEIQQKRIDQGVQSGELNKREAARLERHQAGIEKMENRAKADGTVTKKERAKIHHAQNHESRRIHRQKHDHQRAK
jgi:hypothetical protein